MKDHRFLFQLRLKIHLDKPMIIINAYDGGWTNETHYPKNKIDVEVKQGKHVVFKRGQLWCATPRSIDGIEAKELVLSLVAMKPGDTDKEYFKDYTEEQLIWVQDNGDYISMEREYRYCDENGNLKG